MDKVLLSVVIRTKLTEKFYLKRKLQLDDVKSRQSIELEMQRMQTIYWVLGLIVSGYLLLLVLVYFCQSGMMFHPQKKLLQTPSALGLDYEDAYFTTNDGITLHGWYIPSPVSRGTVLFSHGNAGNISGRLETIRMLYRLGMNVLMYDYRGYGKSKGRRISEEGTYSDILAAWNYLRINKKVPADQIVVMGRSLGGGVTAWLASQIRPAGVILESTFTSATDLAAELYPILPVRLMMKFEYPTLQHLKKNTAPLLVLHSKDDGLIPFHHGRELYQHAPEPKSFFEMGGSHGNGHVLSGKGYIEALDQFLRTVLPGEINKSE